VAVRQSLVKTTLVFFDVLEAEEAFLDHYLWWIPAVCSKKVEWMVLDFRKCAQGRNLKLHFLIVFFCVI
jgi:hypothetical protein